jgi:hypothetical protein
MTRGKKQNLWTRQGYPFGAGIVGSGFAELGTRSLHKAGEKGVDREDEYLCWGRCEDSEERKLASQGIITNWRPKSQRTKGGKNESDRIGQDYPWDSKDTSETKVV